VSWPLACEPYFRRLRGGEALLHAIVEEPWDDDLRLILADWLEEHGQQARAEVIHLQIMRQAILDWHPRKKVLEQQEERLLQENREEWLHGLPEVEGTYRICVYRFSGGLLERLSLNAEMFLRRAGDLFSAVDARQLQVDGLSDPGAFFALPLLARLCSLNLYPNKIGPEGAGVGRVVPPGHPLLSRAGLQPDRRRRGRKARPVASATAALAVAGVAAHNRQSSREGIVDNELTVRGLALLTLSCGLRPATSVAV
jgi:uncharacterized protein (TIGR02996 family)